MTDDNRAEAAAIEQDIRRTQDEIGDTVAKLEEQLTPRELARSVVGDDGSEIAMEALEITRQNPIPVAMIAIGLIWLIATARTRDGSRLVDRISGTRAPGAARSPRPPVAPTASASGFSDPYADSLDRRASPIRSEAPSYAV